MTVIGDYSIIRYHTTSCNFLKSYDFLLIPKFRDHCHYQEVIDMYSACVLSCATDCVNVLVVDEVVVAFIL